MAWNAGRTPDGYELVVAGETSSGERSAWARWIRRSWPSQALWRRSLGWVPATHRIVTPAGAFAVRTRPLTTLRQLVVSVSALPEEEEEQRRAGLRATVVWHGPFPALAAARRVLRGGGHYFFEHFANGRWKPLYTGISRNLASRVPVQWARFAASHGRIRVSIGRIAELNGRLPGPPRARTTGQARRTIEHALIRSTAARGKGGGRQGGVATTMVNRSSILPFRALAPIVIVNKAADRRSRVPRAVPRRVRIAGGRSYEFTPSDLFGPPSTNGTGPP